MPNLYKRGKVWYCDIRIGKRIRRPLDTNKEYAQIKLAKLQEEKLARRFNRLPDKVSWQTFKENYFEWARANKSKGTLGWETLAVKYFENYFNIHFFQQITPALLEGFKTKLKHNNKHVAVVNRLVRVIKVMMRWGERQNLVIKQNWADVKRFKEVSGRIEFLTPQELKQLIKECSQSGREMYLTLVLLCARAGLRASEAYWLEWPDIDFERNRLNITPKPHWVPKDSEARFVPLAPDLKNHLKRIKKTAQTEWVIADGSWRPASVAALSTEFRRSIFHRVTHKEGSLHILRHTFASHLAQAGESLYIIGKLLGHSSPETTQVYAHLCPNTYESAIAKLPKL